MIIKYHIFQRLLTASFLDLIKVNYKTKPKSNTILTARCTLYNRLLLPPPPPVNYFFQKWFQTLRGATKAPLPQIVLICSKMGIADSPENGIRWKGASIKTFCEYCVTIRNHNQFQHGARREVGGASIRWFCESLLKI